MSKLTFLCDLSEATTLLPHFWEHTVGSDHARMALRADWQHQLKRAHEELGFRHVRFHGLLSDDMGTVVRAGDEIRYSFFNSDQILDFLLSIGMKPFVELSFMPSVLASGTKTVFSYEANVTPPRDYKQWATLIEKFVSHLVDRYGEREVSEWFFRSLERAKPEKVLEWQPARLLQILSSHGRGDQKDLAVVKGRWTSNRKERVD